jgi:hypothetical protein
MFRAIFRPSSGAYKTVCGSLGYCHAFLLSTAAVDVLEQPIHTSGSQQESITKPKAPHTVL